VYAYTSHVGDEARRRLERAAQAGDVEAGAQLLVLRQRDGTLSWDRLVLASYLGDPAAQGACGDRDVPDLHDVARWAADNVGPDAVARLARAAAGAVAPPERVAGLRFDGPEDDEAGDFDLVPGGHVENVLHLCVRTVRAAEPGRQGFLLERTLRLAREAFDDEALRRALRDAVVPWLLA
jgi:hypothetical protein